MNSNEHIDSADNSTFECTCYLWTSFIFVVLWYWHTVFHIVGNATDSGQSAYIPTAAFLNVTHDGSDSSAGKVNVNANANNKRSGGDLENGKILYLTL